MFTKNGKALTAIGVKPICPFQQVFQSLYLFGAVSPINGKSFFLQMLHCNSANFQIFLDDFSAQESEELIVIVADNVAFHKAKSLKIPENIIIIFLPPYSPELNPAEKIWAKFKRDFTNRLFKTLDALDKYVCKLATSITSMEIKSICSFNYVFEGNFGLMYNSLWYNTYCWYCLEWWTKWGERKTCGLLHQFIKACTSK